MKNLLKSADTNFQGKDANEDFQFYFHQHWVRLIWPFVKNLIYSAFIITVGYITFITVGIEDALTRRILLLVFGLLFLITNIELISRFYRYFLYVIVITDKKVHRIKKTLLTFDDHQSMDLWMLQDINKCQHGVIQNLFQFGSLILEAQDTVLRLHFVPSIPKKYAMFMRLRERARSTLSQTARTISNNYLEEEKKERPVASTPSRKEVLYWTHAGH